MQNPGLDTAPTPETPEPALENVGIVVIGRNEGERLKTSLRSVRAYLPRVVYVDSGSEDGSVAFARSMGVEVVELDMSTPFTAGRARNEGLERLLSLAPETEFVHFVDGDCEIVAGWLPNALAAMGVDERRAAVWGLLVERHPDATPYNRLCDTEWRWCYPYGDVPYCGGIALTRVAALREVGGFNSALIAGEEPEMCFRMRERGWRIHRLHDDMALHDADIRRFGQWWRRAVRTGYADAESAWMHREDGDSGWLRSLRSVWLWGAGIPIAALAAAPVTGGWSTLFLLLYVVQIGRIAKATRAKGAPVSRALQYAVFCMLAKPAAALGHARFAVLRLTGDRSDLIEYK